MTKGKGLARPSAEDEDVLTDMAAAAAACISAALDRKGVCSVSPACIGDISGMLGNERIADAWRSLYGPLGWLRFWTSLLLTALEFGIEVTLLKAWAIDILGLRLGKPFAATCHAFGGEPRRWDLDSAECAVIAPLSFLLGYILGGKPSGSSDVDLHILQERLLLVVSGSVILESGLNLNSCATVFDDKGLSWFNDVLLREELTVEDEEAFVELEMDCEPPKLVLEGLNFCPTYEPGAIIRSKKRAAFRDPNLKDQFDKRLRDEIIRECRDLIRSFQEVRMRIYPGRIKPWMIDVPNPDPTNYLPLRLPGRRGLLGMPGLAALRYVASSYGQEDSDRKEQTATQKFCEKMETQGIPVCMSLEVAPRQIEVPERLAKQALLFSEESGYEAAAYVAFVMRSWQHLKIFRKVMVLEIVAVMRCFRLMLMNKILSMEELLVVGRRFVRLAKMLEGYDLISKDIKETDPELFHILSEAVPGCGSTVGIFAALLKGFECLLQVEHRPDLPKWNEFESAAVKFESSSRISAAVKFILEHISKPNSKGGQIRFFHPFEIDSSSSYGRDKPIIKVKKAIPESLAGGLFGLENLLTGLCENDILARWQKQFASSELQALRHAQLVLAVARSVPLDVKDVDILPQIDNRFIGARITNYDVDKVDVGIMRKLFKIGLGVRSRPVKVDAGLHKNLALYKNNLLTVQNSNGAELCQESQWWVNVRNLPVPLPELLQIVRPVPYSKSLDTSIYLSSGGVGVLLDSKHNFLVKNSAGQKTRLARTQRNIIPVWKSMLGRVEVSGKKLGGNAHVISWGKKTINVLSTALDEIMEKKSVAHVEVCLSKLPLEAIDGGKKYVALSDAFPLWRLATQMLTSRLTLQPEPGIVEKCRIPPVAVAHFYTQTPRGQKPEQHSEL